MAVQVFYHPCDKVTFQVTAAYTVRISYELLMQLQHAVDLYEFIQTNTEQIECSEPLRAEYLTVIREYMNNCQCDGRFEELVKDTSSHLPHTEWRDCLASRIIEQAARNEPEFNTIVLNDNAVLREFNWNGKNVISWLFTLLQLGFPKLLDRVVAKTQFDFDLQFIIGMADSFNIDQNKMIYVALYMYAMHKRQFSHTKSARYF